MDKLTFISQLVEHLSWPVAIIIIILILRKQLNSLIRKLRKANIKGAELHFDPQTTQKASRIDNEAINTPRPTDKTGLQNEYEELIMRDLKNMCVEDVQERENILISHLATTQINSTYERINGTIFGSQIDLLRSLNSTAHPAKENSLKLFYDNAVQKFPETFTTYPFDAYLNYLINMQLIQAKDDGYIITPIAIGYLIHIAEKGLTGYRPN